MPWNLLILPLIGGYYILSRSNYYRFKQQRLQRQRLIFDTILAGLFLLITTFAIKILIGIIHPPALDWAYDTLIPIKIPYFGTAAFSFIFAFAGVEVTNRYCYRDKNKYVHNAIKGVGNELELILSTSFYESQLIEFTLDTDKVYIGWVKELPIPTVTTYIRIIPFLSGFRNKDKKLRFTTHYANIYAEYIREGKVKGVKDLDVDLILTLDNVVTVSYFDIDMYERFQKIEFNEDVESL